MFVVVIVVAAATGTASFVLVILSLINMWFFVNIGTDSLSILTRAYEHCFRRFRGSLAVDGPERVFILCGNFPLT